MATIKKILVTGGAGFVGIHLCRELVRLGYKVRAMDNLDPQVHGRLKGRPAGFPKEAELQKGDVTNPAHVAKAVKNMDAVVHLAAAVGVGQSMYKIHHYVKVNSLGGAVMLEAIVKNRKALKKVLVASSMSIYGEGAYACESCGPVNPGIRSNQDLERREWEALCPQCNRRLRSIPTPESKPLNPTSIYAVTKRDHEENFLCVGQAYQVPTVALRFFNIYGPLQALSNPYTGVAAIFSSRLLNNEPPIIFEDGNQSRDFIHVSDIVQGLVLDLTKPGADYGVVNVGTGESTSVLRMAQLLGRRLGVAAAPQLLNKFRAGDIRHCYADISRIRRLLGFEPRVRLEKGIDDLIAWVKNQTGKDKVGAAVTELNKMGLVL